MALADTVQEKHEPCSCEYYSSVDEVQLRLTNLQVSGPKSLTDGN